MALFLSFSTGCPKIKALIKNFNCELIITLLHSFKLLWIEWICKVSFDILFIGFGSLKVKLQSFFGDVSVLKVCKLNTNYAIKFYKCSKKKLLSNVQKKMFFIYEES